MHLTRFVAPVVSFRIVNIVMLRLLTINFTTGFNAIIVALLIL
jgi:hypothetical protein